MRYRGVRTVASLHVALLVLAGLLLVVHPAAASPVSATLGRTGTDEPVGAAFELIDPPIDPLDTAAVAAMPGRRPPETADVTDQRVFWGRLTVDAASDAPGRWMLAPDRNWQRVVLYDPRTGPRITGVAIPIYQRPVPEGRQVLPIAIAPGETRSFALRFEGNLAGWEPPESFLADLVPEKVFYEEEQRADLFLGLYAGLLLAITFVNMLFGTALRERLFIDYVVYAVPYALIWVAHAWKGAELLWPGTPWVDQTVLFMTICAAIVLGNRFAMHFLDLRNQLPPFHRALVGVNVLIALVIGLALIGYWAPVPHILGGAAIATCVVYLIAGVLLATRGHRDGRFFVAATGTMALGTIIYTLRAFDILPPWPLTEQSAQIGSAIEMMILALALADRVRIADRQRRAAEIRLREELEREVAARTAELATTNDQLIAVNRRLETLSMTDALTGVANRRRFEAMIEDEWRRSVRERAPMAVMLVDVDLFKAYNDELGHQAGDDCLRHVARILAAGTRRAGDLLARYGGEEFVLVLPGMTDDAALVHAERLRRSVADAAIPHPRSKVSRHVTVSIGVAVSSDAVDRDGDELIARADAALYRAKRTGRNRVMSALDVTDAGDDDAAETDTGQRAS